MTKTERKAVAWLFSAGTGESSMTMCRFFLLGDVRRMSSPADAGDFGRCHRLLCAVPEWRRRVPELAQLGGEWVKLSRSWDRLTRLYLAGDGALCAELRKARSK